MKTLRVPGGCCSGIRSGCGPCVSRRGFLALGAASPLAGAVAAAPAAPRPLRVQPVFFYEPKQPRRAASWRWSAEIYTAEAAAAEQQRIRGDLDAMGRDPAFPLQFLPLKTVTNAAEANAAAEGDFDVCLQYPSCRRADLMAAMVRPGRRTLIFVRRLSGPIYYMYIGVHGHFLRKQGDQMVQPGVGVEDIVVDSREDLLWRLRALAGLQDTMGTRIVAVGNAGGWGRDGAKAPARAVSQWNVDIVPVSYQDLDARLRAARSTRAAEAREECRRYLAGKGVKPETAPAFIENSFLLLGVFRDLIREAGASAFTINGCMQTVMPVSETTACLPLSILNDEGVLAFCESDFVSIPAGVLLARIARRPVFLGNGSFPYNGNVTMSHCTAPRRMDGRERDPIRLLTHYESDFGAAPKVEMRKGQSVTLVDADFAGRRWLDFGGKIAGAPFHPICRTQVDVSVAGDTAKLAKELRGWHWILAYGEWSRELGYALGKAGLESLHV